MRNVYFLCLCLSSFALVAQAGETDAPAYVQGPIYKVINAADGPVILWEGKPAASSQLVRSAEDLLTVYPPDATDARLLVYLRPDGRMKEVIDLEYQDDPRKKYPDTAFTEFAEAGTVEVVFKNGMIFTYEAGKATAVLDGESLPVTGANGRYRIKTEHFEAGVAFAANAGSRVYHYFKPL